ncbi:NTP transferase domain-containing protein [Paenibacillus jilunlii]|uniref:CTP:phosphocholine cytidylyltransferase n=1 Tax=Paenibacillus jilunlii TaxID=682956 RepID=A0A1G9VNM3_9BACL|nr:NTP transferase domain-containing protein [Paenibacillus jilunlii]SDM73838.1 CTP:phosphocholine cytidylyltransferase [Paenibacillus jilunlii]
MNKIMFDIMLLIKDGNSWDVKEYARRLFKPYSIIEQEYRSLVYDKYIAEDKLTQRGEQYLNGHTIENAIILAAGVSSRFVPLCFEKPKALLEVKGEVMIERQICQLKEAGISEIIIVVGHMKEMFSYLVEKYDVKLVETDTYKVRNNHASVYAAREYLKNTIITSADLYFNENIFQKYAFDAYYCTVYREGVTDERGIETDVHDRICNTFYGVSDTWITLGYAFFNERFSKAFLEILDKEYNSPETMQKFWADIQDEHLSELYMYAKRCNGNIIYEFDSLEELREFDISYCNDAQSALLCQIAENMRTSENNLRNFKPITKEDLGRGFTFTFEQKRYICRITKDLEVLDIKRYDNEIQELVNLTESFITYYDKTLPLCAAENVISPFANMPLSMGFQERYIVGNTYSYSEQDNFIGSSYLLPFYQMISDQCYKLFGAKYSDARTLTGMNCLMMVLSALSEIGDSILNLGASAGGHASVKPIAERLGLEVGEVPFDFEKQDIDYDKLNQRLKDEKIKFVLLAPSDIIRPFQFEKIDTTNTTVLYDASQLLGLIAADLIDNPIKTVKNMVMFGGTHKTFPGPASGLILTNSEELHKRLETSINPIYIRHTQMHQKVSLLFAMIEFETFGKSYQEHIVELSNVLSAELEERGFKVGKVDDNKYTSTHEVFIYTDKEIMDRIFENSIRFGVTLNKKKKELFYGYGIRLGTQEVARYGWPKDSMKAIAEIIYEISLPVVDDRKVQRLLSGMPPKKIQYTFDDATAAYFKRFVQ